MYGSRLSVLDNKLIRLEMAMPPLAILSREVLLNPVICCRSLSEGDFDGVIF